MAIRMALVLGLQEQLCWLATPLTGPMLQQQSRTNKQQQHLKLSLPTQLANQDLQPLPLESSSSNSSSSKQAFLHSYPQLMAVSAQHWSC